ncbi:hypothetical protein ACFPYJ_17980 [Paenibacillus solisilvae]|uniref:Uncharacterized protein n=1 Tax=Paenibacillus solisilvae TaxID=2486751 RepID=A0ABW0VZT7_9BACL
MDKPSTITLEEMMSEAELFQSVYSELASEIERGESTRGKLNDFQLMQAVAHAKDGLGVMSYERRQIINAIFEAFSAIYRRDGRPSAEIWATETFGCIRSEVKREDLKVIEERMVELNQLIQLKEKELLQLYREFHMMNQYLAQNE